jgi:uncharacterized membrane protein HdeD (DUF308 family)
VEIVLVRSWKAVALRGVASMLFGSVAVLWPTITLTALVLLFGMYALADGVLALLAATRRGERTRAPLVVFEAFIGIGAGLAALLWTSMTTLVLVALMGAWAIVTGLLEIAVAIRLRRVVPGELLLGLAGGLSVVLGILMLVGPHASAFAIVVLLGCYALFFGASIVALALRLRRSASSIVNHRVQLRPREA